jgi:hypothetical protein
MPAAADETLEQNKNSGVEVRADFEAPSNSDLSVPFDLVPYDTLLQEGESEQKPVPVYNHIVSKPR